MMVIDVIREASDEHEIFFLVTAYIEAVRYCDKLKNLPEQMWELPLAGTIDLERRFDRLKFELTRPTSHAGEKDRLTIREAAHIFAAALHRLRTLPRPGSLPSQYPENVRHHALAALEHVAAPRVTRRVVPQSTIPADPG